jgi:hypothetical protein
MRVLNKNCEKSSMFFSFMTRALAPYAFEKLVLVELVFVVMRHKRPYGGPYLGNSWLKTS